MRYSLLAFSSLLLLSINLFSQGNPSIVDTTYIYRYTIDGDTLPQTRNVKGYNLSMKLVYDGSASWDIEKNAWRFVSKNLYDYIEDGQFSLIERYNWSDEKAMWIGTQKRTTNYDENNNQDSSVTFSWYEGAWVNKEKTIFKIDSFGRFLYQAQYLWDTLQNTWELQTLSNKEVDSMGRVVMQESYQRDNAGVLIGQSKQEHVYKVSHNEILLSNFPYNRFDR